MHLFFSFLESPGCASGRSFTVSISAFAGRATGLSIFQTPRITLAMTPHFGRTNLLSRRQQPRTENFNPTKRRRRSKYYFRPISLHPHLLSIDSFLVLVLVTKYIPSAAIQSKVAEIITAMKSTALLPLLLSGLATDAAQLGPRPFWLVDQMLEGDLKDELSK